MREQFGINHQHPLVTVVSYYCVLLSLILYIFGWDVCCVFYVILCFRLFYDLLVFFVCLFVFLVFVCVCGVFVIDLISKIGIGITVILYIQK